MLGYIVGYTDTNNINYCPKCGASVSMYYGDGTATCEECGMRFGVVEVDKEDDI